MELDSETDYIIVYEKSRWRTDVALSLEGYMSSVVVPFLVKVAEFRVDPRARPMVPSPTF